jgi:hypothetical protein
MSRQDCTIRLTAALCVLWMSPLMAGQAVVPPPARPRPGAAAPPAAPIPPATVSRSAEGGVTVRAVRLSTPLRLDGKLDESVYAEVPAIDGFIQQDPREGEPATEKTDVWILFDDNNIYISARCWDSQPEREIANEMRRDSGNILQNEAISILFDTFHDRRSGFNFSVSVLGGQFDTALTSEAVSNRDWNGVWDARTGRFESGWTVEVAFPFKSLRYGAGREQIWGVNIRRIVRWKNEVSHLTPVPAFLGLTGHVHASLAATMVGLEVPPAGLNLDVKPYAISGLRTDRTARPAFANKGDGDAGLDVKYGITKSLTLDLTYNTDFAQVEDDVQQVNLTRFNLFFPERRDFFVEGQGIFAFGGVNTAAQAAASLGNTPVLFFSRRIGLNEGREVPIVAGGRVTGKAGAYTVGVLNIQAGDEPDANARATNFSVVRVRRDLFGRSNIGAMYTRRAETSGGGGAGETFGVDALYSASRSLNVNASLARTRAPGVRRDDSSEYARFDYNADRYGLQAEHLSVGANFNPEVGFVRRTDFQRQFVNARFSPRPARTHMKAVRRFVYQGSIEYLENGAGRLDLRETVGSFELELLSSDSVTINHARTYELIPQPFAIAPDVVVPAGGYDYQASQVSYFMGQQHRLSGTILYQHGSLYGGTKRTLGMSAGRLELTSQLAVEPIASINWVKLPSGEFTSRVVSGRITYALSPRMFVSALVQDNSSAKTLSINARWRWEYRPGSELFVVYSDGRDTALRGAPTLLNRAFVVKINRLFRF